MQSLQISMTREMGKDNEQCLGDKYRIRLLEYSYASVLCNKKSNIDLCNVIANISKISANEFKVISS